MSTAIVKVQRVQHISREEHNSIELITAIMSLLVMLLRIHHPSDCMEGYGGEQGGGGSMTGGGGGGG